MKDYFENFKTEHPIFWRRWKSFWWRFLPALGLFVIGFVTDWIDKEYKEETVATLIIVYVLNEITKYLNKKAK